MTCRYPPRREPRVLAIRKKRNVLLHAVVDLWEVRGAGHVPIHGPRGLRVALRRLVRREKPTLLASESRRLAKRANAIVSQEDLRVVTGKFPCLPVSIARDMYPELPIHAPTPDLARLVTVGISTILHVPHHPRKYAPRTSRNPSPPRPR